MKKILYLFLTILILITCIKYNINAQNIYLVKALENGEFTELKSFSDEYAALWFYNSKKDKYQNIYIEYNSKVIEMKYGIVEFLSNETCGINTNYDSIELNNQGYINACYGADGAYLYTKNGYIYFKIASDIGKVKKNQVNLIPFELLNVTPSMYEYKNSTLYHLIKTQLTSNYYQTSIAIDKDVLNLEEGLYYSYDSRYFYKDFYMMIDDYVNDTNQNAFNNEAYYNYYQYLPHRSISNYSAKEVENYFKNDLSFTSKLDYYFDINKDYANDVVNKSQYVDEISNFFKYQYIYGSNAMMMLALSINESAYGKSALAYYKNNLFGHSAFDNDVERSASRYLNIESSIYSHSRYYISNMYSNYDNTFLYYGSHFGSKLSGMNVKYASDPYWSEKAVSHYFNLDLKLGLKDKNKYKLVVIENQDEINIYKDDKLNDLIKTLSNYKAMSFIVLEELDNVYKIQLDKTYTSDNTYNFNDSIGYISKENVKHINDTNPYENKLKKILINLNGGKIINKDELVYFTNEEKLESIDHIFKEGYEFIGFEENDLKVIEDRVFTAKYKKIKSIEVENLKTEIALSSYYDLRNAQMKILYEDGTSKKIKVNSNMISNFDNTKEGIQTITISYCGIQTQIQYNVSLDLKNLKDKIYELINKNINSFNDNQTYDIDEVNFIKYNAQVINYSFTMDQIRILDRILLNHNKNDYKFYLNDSKFDMSISGLAFSLVGERKKEFIYSNTYYAQIKDSNISSNIIPYLQGYGFKYVDSFNIKFNYNLESIETINPFVVQVKVDNKLNDKVYSVYYIDSNNDVIKLRTTHTNNYIQFLCLNQGDYVILEKDSANTYLFENGLENISASNNAVDLISIYIRSILFVIVFILNLVVIIVYKILDNKLKKLKIKFNQNI